ncbi:MAG: hypothetical protein J2P58_02885, partial [Acidimicrobiaceae bacterium]|nr:hypothetical protein [Acidimicrobiaceae bacterium]
AARRNDFDSLVAVLDPEVVLRADRPAMAGGPQLLEGPAAVANQAMLFADPRAVLHPVLVNGAAGVVVTVDGRAVSVMSFTVTRGRIVEIDAVADPERAARLAAPLAGGS